MAASAETKLELLGLMQEKDRLEAQIRCLHEEEMQMCRTERFGEASLVDEEGFPRADIDVFAVRVVRNRAAVAQTDHVNLMKQIEKLLLEFHRQVGQEAPSSRVQGAHGAQGEADVAAPEDSQHRLPEEPFCIIRGVLPGSPAHSAGLRDGDQVLLFGSVSVENAPTAEARNQALPLAVQSSLNNGLAVWVLRESEPVECLLVPRKWDGPGLVGCQFT